MTAQIIRLRDRRPADAEFRKHVHLGEPPQPVILPVLCIDRHEPHLGDAVEAPCDCAPIDVSDWDDGA